MDPQFQLLNRLFNGQIAEILLFKLVVFAPPQLDFLFQVIDSVFAFLAVLFNFLGLDFLHNRRQLVILNFLALESYLIQGLPHYLFRYWLYPRESFFRLVMTLELDKLVGPGWRLRSSLDGSFDKSLLAGHIFKLLPRMMVMVWICREHKIKFYLIFIGLDMKAKL